ncbi:MAG TPA: type II toxin-antitoxin system RelE/ParE family toxin [Terriglobus sp.]
MRLEWTALALEDRNAIFDYIMSDSPQAAVQIDLRIEEHVDQLLHFPESGRLGRVEGTRELVILHTPYIVAYQVMSEVVLILRVLHGAQRWPEEIK